VHKELHATDLVWKWFAILGGGTVYPVIEEGLMACKQDASSIVKEAERTGLDSDTKSVRGTIYKCNRWSSNEAAASDI
jgi:hypothetical protein